ncbi:hypothetical protein PMAYCL1PPCAC_22374, partial [Pristionchus mayeri]
EEHEILIMHDLESSMYPDFSSFITIMSTDYNASDEIKEEPADIKEEPIDYFSDTKQEELLLKVLPVDTANDVKEEPLDFKDEEIDCFFDIKQEEPLLNVLSDGTDNDIKEETLEFH